MENYYFFNDFGLPTDFLTSDRFLELSTLFCSKMLFDSLKLNKFLLILSSKINF